MCQCRLRQLNSLEIGWAGGEEREIGGRERGGERKGREKGEILREGEIYGEREEGDSERIGERER